MRKYSVLLCLATTIILGQTPGIRESVSNHTPMETIEALAQDFSLSLQKDAQSIASLSQKDTILDYKLKQKGYDLQRVNPDGVAIYYASNNSKALEFSKVNLLHKGSLTQSSLLGQNMIVGLIDADVVLETHREFQTNSNLGRAHIKDKAHELAFEDSEDYTLAVQKRNHSTHVAGTLISQGLQRESMGILPQGSVYSYNWTQDILKIIDLANQGVLISNHSYGLAALSEDNRALIPAHYFGMYSREAISFDRVMRDFPFFQSVVAAGNDRQNYLLLNPLKKGDDLLLGHALSKNAIVVGAIIANGRVLDVPGFSDTYFSNYGPTADFRVKPDIVASGVGLISSIYKQTDVQNQQVANNNYGVKSGTSMATPVVSGILTLWQQWALENRNYPYKASSIKAVMIHTADPLQQSYGPSHKYGWGLINAFNGNLLLNNALHDKALIIEDALYDAKGFSSSVVTSEDSKRLSFTLVWNDLPGQDKIINPIASLQPDLVNDLDLRVIDPYGQQYYPWALNKSYTDLRAVQGDNDVDNVEKVDIFDAPAGRYQILIRAKQTSSAMWQDFSLVVSDQDFAGLSIPNTIKQDKVLPFEIWPNPASRELHLMIPKEIVFQANTLQVYNALGQLIDSKVVYGTDHYELNVERYTRGVYFLTIKSDRNQYQAKFLKK